MADVRRFLYAVAIPPDAQKADQDVQPRDVSKIGVVAGGVPQADSRSTPPGDFVLEGAFRGVVAERQAHELRELAHNQHVDVAPLFGYNRNGSHVRTDTDGYYVIEDAEIAPDDPRNATRGFYRWKVGLTRKGGRRTHRRAIETTPIDSPHDFGSTSEALVAVPQSASKVRWFEPTTKNRDHASPTTSGVATEFATVDLYDANSAPYSEPVLLHDMPYDGEAYADAKVWDDHNTTKVETASDGTEYVAWQRVFSPTHEYGGDPVIENGRLRLVFDEATNGLSAFRWDDANSQYASVSLGASDWELYQIDVHDIAMARVEAQVEFRDPTQSPTAYHPLDLVLYRGHENAHWLRPANLESTTTPSGLQTLLDPIASPRLNPQSELTVRERGEIRQ